MKPQDLHTAQQIITLEYQSVRALQPLTYAALDELHQASLIDCMLKPVYMPGYTSPRAYRHLYRAAPGKLLDLATICPLCHMAHSPAQEHICTST